MPYPTFRKYFVEAYLIIIALNALINYNKKIKMQFRCFQILSKAQQEAKIVHPCQEEDRPLHDLGPTQEGQRGLPDF